MASLSFAQDLRTQPDALSADMDLSSGLAQHKLTRLLELRAVIDAMRCEHSAGDPLLSWVIARERSGNPIR